jgi:trehalose 6-phosphate synthase/phosphatase
MSLLRQRVTTHDVHWWARSFVARLEGASTEVSDAGISSASELRAAVERVRAEPRLVLLLDYDGTLVPFTPTPELATPDEELLALIRSLAGRRDTAVHLVSGRRRASLDRWFSDLPVTLHAEHGFWTRPRGGDWTPADVQPGDWREPVLAILRDFAERTPGALIEEKTAGFAWHYRAADPEWGAAQAKELSLHLSTLLANVPVELLPGNMVLEVRPFGINKGLVVQRAREEHDGAALFAMGDDRTDEDLFAALPEGSVAVHVGRSPTRAPLRVPDVAAARSLLSAIAAG